MTAQDQPTSANVTPLQISTTEHMDEHIKAMVELLRRNNAILDLPKATFDIVLPVLGMNAVKILKAELESLRYEEVEKNYYDDDGFGKPDTYVKIPHDKIYRLSTIPCGFDAATNVLLNDLASHLAHAQSKDHFDPVEFCYEADEQLGEMVQFQLSVCDMLGLKWEASRLASSIEKVYSRKRGAWSVSKTRTTTIGAHSVVGRGVAIPTLLARKLSV